MMTIPVTIGLLFLLLFLKVAQLVCLGLAKFIERVILREARESGINREIVMN